MPSHIGEYGEAFKNGEIIPIVINDDWNTAIWAIFRVPRLFLNVLSNINALENIILAICRLQFLENDGSFDAIGSAKSK